MAEKLEDFNLPLSVVQRIVKESINENVNIGKEARIALARAAAVFVLYVTSHSSQVAQKVNRKTLLAEDVFEALKNLDFGELVEPLQLHLQEYKEEHKKKDKSTVNKSAEGGEEEIEEDNDDD
ncbi:DNA polymerase epsilon subunit 3 [Photinus pyralis]|uniref:DNA polymerase epsilon subunit 3 n=1 Tax=Photinus pyralis TaxID=7054 RepID=A0A1Y1KWJ5_PHOPY|nr:DNA polymerase epsilon subunit 3 [Photinus pyralis]